MHWQGQAQALKFGVKVSCHPLKHSKGGQFVAHMLALPGNPMTATRWLR
jgi:hypothetical protein